MRFAVGKLGAHSPPGRTCASRSQGARLWTGRDVAPSIVILAGPNGAGKTTAAPFLLRDALAVTEFVNADQIAHGLSAFNPETVAIEAGRLMLARLDELARRHATFAFETTLASRSMVASAISVLNGHELRHLGPPGS